MQTDTASTNGTEQTHPGELDVSNLIVAYGDNIVIKNMSIKFKQGSVTAVIGPSGCGKTTLIRCLNRMSDLTDSCSVQGAITLDGENALKMDPVLLRRRVGMVFQKPNPFPMSIRDNVTYGVKAHNQVKGNLSALTQRALEQAALWDEVKDRLGASALALSVGQQQRLCIARAIAVSPEVLLMDEPAASLDPVSTMKLEDSIVALKGKYTVIMVTHDVQEAQRISDYTAFIQAGEIVEYGETRQIFESPEKQATKDYLSGRLLAPAVTV